MAKIRITDSKKKWMSVKDKADLKEKNGKKTKLTDFFQETEE